MMWYGQGIKELSICQAVMSVNLAQQGVFRDTSLYDNRYGISYRPISPTEFAVEKKKKIEV